MNVFLVRHAIAHDRENYRKKVGGSDEFRPLTKEGRVKFKFLAKAYVRLFPGVEMIVTSPLVRGYDTARLLASKYPTAQFIVTDTLRPSGNCKKLMRFLQSLGRVENVVLVGHEPQLGRMLSYLVFGDTSSRCEIKKGGLVHLSFSARPRRGQAKMVCYIPPTHLKKINRSL